MTFSLDGAAGSTFITNNSSVLSYGYYGIEGSISLYFTNTGNLILVSSAFEDVDPYTFTIKIYEVI